MGLDYALCKWDKTMCSENGTIQCALGMGLANVHWEAYYQIWSVNWTIQCALGMGLANVLYEWDY